jgi:hypothetical protein
LLLFACAALLAIGGCVGAYHDGLPAWTPPAGKTESSIGYHRPFWPDGGGSSWYLTPGVRSGLLQPPLAGDIGLTSVVMERGGKFGALLGPVLGIGYQSSNFCFVVRPSAYVVGFSGGGGRFFLWWQVSLLAGNSAQAGRTHVSGGGRANATGAGPVLLVDHSFGSVNLRLEGSYMFPYGGSYNMFPGGTYTPTDGQLTVGLTVGGPAPQSEEEWSLEGY